MKDGFSFTLNSPLTKEDWNKICDAELEHTKKIVYKTPSGKEVTFISLAELEKIKAETIIDELEKIKAEIEYYRKNHNCDVLKCLDIIDKEIKAAWRNRWRKGENK